MELADAVKQKAERAIDVFGAERVLLNPDCGFATFADNPVNTAEIAEQKLAVIARVAAELREEHAVGAG